MNHVAAPRYPTTSRRAKACTLSGLEALALLPRHDRPRHLHGGVPGRGPRPRRDRRSRLRGASGLRWPSPGPLFLRTCGPRRRPMSATARTVGGVSARRSRPSPATPATSSSSGSTTPPSAAPTRSIRGPGFRALLDRIVSNGVRTVIVEDASRFARTLMVQEAGIATLAGLGVRVLTSRGDDLTDSDDEMRVAMRQIAGVFSQLEKTRLVKKLRGPASASQATGKRSRAEIARRDVPGGREGGQAVAAGEPEDRRAAQLPRDQRQAGRSRSPERARPALQRAVGTGDDRRTAATGATSKPMMSGTHM